VIQAEEMPDLERRRDLYRNGVEAAERALGPEPFVEDVGHFWGILETRPYMRARNGFAGALWDSGERDEAIEHWQDLLRLCPNDNMGVRYGLVPRLIEANRDTEAEQVLDQYEGEPMATPLYARALLEFRRSGAGPAARSKLDAAMRANPRVPGYLTGRATMDDPLPNSYARGSDEEAQICTSLLLGPWHSTDGAVEWLSGAIRPPKSERRAKRKRGARKGKK
jgi:tetratricopeptide (TPR) repeat protein